MEEAISDSEAAKLAAKEAKDIAKQEKAEVNKMRQADKIRADAKVKQERAHELLGEHEQEIKKEKHEQGLLRKEIANHTAKIAASEKQIKDSEARVQKVKGETQGSCATAR